MHINVKSGLKVCIHRVSVTCHLSPVTCHLSRREEGVAPCTSSHLFLSPLYQSPYKQTGNKKCGIYQNLYIGYIVWLGWTKLEKSKLNIFLFINDSDSKDL